MRRNIITITLFSLFFILYSCKKVLNTQPKDFVTADNYYNTEDELNRALSGVYQMLATDGLYGSYLHSTLQTSDEFFYRPSGTGALVMDIDASDTRINSLWRGLYEGINRANLLLENIHKPQMDEQKRGVIKGEALFLRAYFYFLLVDYFGDVPLKLASTQTPIGTEIAETPTGKIYEQLVKDMKTASSLVLPSSAYTYNGHVSKQAVQGMLAKVFLTMAGQPLKDITKYKEALLYADSVIQSGLHSLNPSYQQIFINHSAEVYDTKEGIWEIEFSGDNTGSVRAAGRVGILNGIQSAGISWPGYGDGNYNTTKRLYDTYAVGDLRRDWNIANIRYASVTGSTTANEVPVTTTTIYDRNVGKWRRKYENGIPAQSFNATNFPVLRYADVLLMYAEAYYFVHGIEDGRALEVINQVRRRAFGLPVNVPATSVSVVNRITLSTTGNTGYLGTVTQLPITFSGGGGSGASGIAIVNATTGKVSSVVLVNTGGGYTTAPTVIIGRVWTANTDYALGTQVYNGNNLYTVTKAGTSTVTAPTNTSGNSNATLTGAEFSYAGLRATATATIGSTAVDLQQSGVSDFLKEVMMPERARELAFEGARLHDLKRWGKYVEYMGTLKTEIEANAPANYTYAAAAARNISARNVLFPIPNSEFIINGLVTQNTGW